MNKLVWVMVLFFSTYCIHAQSVITVTGEASQSVVPDKVVIKVAITHSGKEYKVVQQKVNDGVNTLIKSLKTIDFPKKNIQTQWVNLSQPYDYESKQKLYKAYQSLDLIVDDIKHYEKIMAIILESGVNQIEQVQFLASNTEEIVQEVRKKAMLNAQQKALDYTLVLGQKIGKATSIQEGRVTPIRPMNEMAVFKSSGVSDAETIAVGTIEINAQVSVSFELL
jgi:uncharacterized protein